jgi:5-methylthioadenosine/S-adenosylhomocysteine deaminase
MATKALLIVNARYLDPALNLCTGNILIKNGIIEKISPDPICIDRDHACINADKLIASPGLINAHTHLPMVLFRGLGDGYPLDQWLHKVIFPMEAQLTPEDVYAASMLAIAESIHAGCTCLADMYFFVEEIARAVDVSGIRAALSLGLVAMNGEKGLQDAEAFYKTYHQSSNSRISVHLAPHAIYTCPREYLKEIVTLSTYLDSKIHIHINETKKEIDDHFATYHQHPIETMHEIGLFERPVLAAHCVHLSDHEIKLLSEAKNFLLVHNPSSNMKLASGIAPIAKYHEKKIPLALGTDGAASNNNLNIFLELRLASLLANVSQMDAGTLSSKDMFRMASSNPGRFLGPEKLGIIEEKAPADVILIDLDESHCLPHHNILSNLLYAVKGSEVDTMIVNGQVIMKNKVICSFDETEIKRNFLRISQKFKPV